MKRNKHTTITEEEEEGEGDSGPVRMAQVMIGEVWTENTGIDPFRRSGIPRTPPEVYQISTHIEEEQEETCIESESAKRKRGGSSTPSPDIIEKKLKNQAKGNKTEKEIELGEEVSEEDSYREEESIIISSDENERNNTEKSHRRNIGQQNEEQGNIIVNNENINNLKETLKKLQDKLYKRPKIEISRIIEEAIEQVNKIKEDWEQIKNDESRRREEYKEIATQTETQRSDKSTQKGNELTEIRYTDNIEEFRDMAGIYWNEECYKKTILKEEEMENIPLGWAIVKEEVGRVRNNADIEEGYLDIHAQQEAEEGTVVHVLNTAQIKTGKGNKSINRHTYYLRIKKEENGQTTDEDIFRSLNDLKKELGQQEIKEVAMNRIGGRKTKVGWGTVRKLIECIFYDMDINFHIYGMKKAKGDKTKPKGKESWAQAVGRKARDDMKTNKRKEQKEKKPVTRNTDAVIITTKTNQYGTILRQIKENINPQDLGINVKAIRKTRQGDILLETKKGDDSKILKGAIERIITNEQVKVVNENSKKTTLVIKDIEEGATKDEVTAAIKRNMSEEEAQSYELRSLRPSYGGTQTAIITLGTKTANKILQEGKDTIRIGWITCQIRKWIEVTQCFRCHSYEHVAATCKGEDHRGLCINCGQEGHRKEQCQEEPKCLNCKEAGHRAGTANCPKHRIALGEARRRDRIQSATA